MMRISKMMLLLALTLMGIFAFQSCSDEEEEPIDLGYDYFPLQVGKYIVYDVDSTLYSNNGFGSEVIIYNNSIQVREEITDSFTDNEERTVYNIERSERKNETEEWRVKDVWTATIKNGQAERTEEGLRFVKLVFPVIKETKSWDGNKYLDDNIINPTGIDAFFIFKDWRYKYGEIGESLSVGSYNFDDVVTVYQADDENFLRLRHSYEQYAKGVGLVYREASILDTQCVSACVNETWESKAEEGFIVRQSIRDYN